MTKLWTVKYSRYYTPYESEHDTREEALADAAWITDEGYGYVIEVVSTEGKTISKEEIFEYIDAQDGG